MSHQITMRIRGVFEADHEVIVIGKESPCLQNERVIFREFKGCMPQQIQFRTGIEEALSMQRCRSEDVGAARREVMRRRVWPTFTHTTSLSQLRCLAKAVNLHKPAESDATTRAHSKSFAKHKNTGPVVSDLKVASPR